MHLPPWGVHTSAPVCMCVVGARVYALPLSACAMCMCSHVSTQACAFTCENTCMCTSACMCMPTHAQSVQVWVQMFICARACLQVCVHTWMPVHASACVHVCTVHVSAHVCMQCAGVCTHGCLCTYSMQMHVYSHVHAFPGKHVCAYGMPVCVNRCLCMYKVCKCTCSGICLHANTHARNSAASHACLHADVSARVQFLRHTHVAL